MNNFKIFVTIIISAGFVWTNGPIYDENLLKEYHRIFEAIKYTGDSHYSRKIYISTPSVGRYFFYNMKELEKWKEKLAVGK